MKTPEPLYPCSIEACREQFSFPARDLFWVEKRQKWVCLNCFDHESGLGIEDRGISLAEHLKQTVAVVPRELDEEQERKFNDLYAASVRTWVDDSEWPISLYRKAIETVEIKEKTQ